MFFVKVHCENEQISTDKNHALPGTSEMTREQLANIIVGADSLIMITFLLALWLIEFLIKIDIARQGNFLMEYRDFAV